MGPLPRGPIEMDLQVGARGPTPHELRRNFLLFTIAFAVNHGVVTTPLVISSSVLNTNVAYLGNAFVNLCTMISSFFVGAPFVGKFGPKAGALFGMLLYCVYCGLFTAAAAVGNGWVDAQYALYVTGSCIGGIAAGVLWVAQGVYFSRTVDLLNRAEGTPVAELSAKLAGNFAALYLGFELVSKLVWSLLDALKYEGHIIAMVYTIIGGLSMCLQMRTFALGATSTSATPRVMEKVAAAVALWSDPVIFLLSGSNLTFGFCAAFMNGYVNANYTKVQLGSSFVTLMAALTTLTATVFAKLLAPLGARIGKQWIILMGSMCFFGIPACFFVLGCCNGWHYFLILLYMFQGIGRAVYESTNKGVFKDYFPDVSDGAFANCMLQSSCAFSLCFFLSNVLSGKMLAGVVLVLSIYTPVALAAAHALRLRQRGVQEHFNSPRGPLNEPELLKHEET